MSDRSAPVGRRGLALLAGAALFLLAASVAAVLLVPGLGGADDGPTPTAGIAEGEGFSCDADEAARFVPYLDGVALVASDRVARIDLHGRTLWSIPLEMESPVAAVSGDRLLVHDAGGFSAAAFGADGLAWKVETEGHLDGATISPSGHVVLLTDISGAKGVFNVYDPDGTWRFGWQSAETGYVLSAAVDPTGSRVDVSALYTDGAAARPVMRSFAMDGKSLAQKTLDDGPALPLVSFDEQGRTVLCGEDGVVGFAQGQRAGEVAYRLGASGVRAVLRTAKGLVWIRSGPSGTGLVAARLRNGAEGPACALPSELSAVAASGDRLAAASGASLSVVDLSKGTVSVRRVFDAEVLSVGFPDDRHAVVVTKAAVLRIALP